MTDIRLITVVLDLVLEYRAKFIVSTFQQKLTFIYLTSKKKKKQLFVM